MDLNTLLDERAIYLQICALAEAMDQRDWAALDHILTEDADGDYGPNEKAVGRPASLKCSVIFWEIAARRSI